MPVSIISTNFEPGNPGLLTHDEVIILFHEFGRMLEHTLSANNYISLTGNNNFEGNTIEMVGEFMSKWSWQYQVIKDISQNISTGDDLPRDMLDDLHSRYIFDSGMNILRQAEMSLLDLRLHLNAAEDKNKSPLDILNEIRQQYAVVPYITTDRLITRFSNIYNGNNAAGYYNFIFLDVMACDAYSAFSDSGFFNYTTGSKFLNTVVAQSGQKSTQDLFIDFRGKPPSIDPYLVQYGIK
jgi:oligopeptidase A